METNNQERPSCEFSYWVVSVLNSHSVVYKDVNVLEDPNIRIDLSYTELSKYREKGVAALVYNKQTVETGMVSTGFTISDILDLLSNLYSVLSILYII